MSDARLNRRRSGTEGYREDAPLRGNKYQRRARPSGQGDFYEDLDEELIPWG